MVQGAYVKKRVNLSVVGAFVEEGLIGINPLPDRSGRKKAVGLESVMKEGTVTGRTLLRYV